MIGLDKAEGEGQAVYAASLPRYKSHKSVWALEIDSIGPQETKDGPARIAFRDEGYDPILAPGEMFSRYQPVAGDFYVVYADNYRSFSPRKAFLEGYTREQTKPTTTIAELEEILREPNKRVHINPDGSVSVKD